MFPVALSRARGGQIRRILTAALAALLLVGVTAIVPGSPGETDARAAAWVGNSLKKHEVWDPAPATLDWVPGHPKGYAEGETAAFRVTVEADSGEQLMFHACLDYDDSGAYAFTGIDPWDSSYNGMTPPPAIADLTGQVAPGFDGAGLNVDSVNNRLLTAQRVQGPPRPDLQVCVSLLEIPVLNVISIMIEQNQTLVYSVR